MYSAYLFDFDYTLGDATDGIVESVNYALVQMKLEKATKKEIRQTIGMHLADTYKYLTRDNDKDNQMLFAQLFKQRADIVMLENTKLFGDTEVLLKNIKKKKIKTAIVTTKYHYRIIEILKKYDISSFVDVIIGGEDVKNQKPHPEPIEKALKILDVPRFNCVYIGDSIIDAETAYRAKIDFIAVTTGTTQKDEFEKFPNIKIVSCLAELPDLQS